MVPNDIDVIRKIVLYAKENPSVPDIKGKMVRTDKGHQVEIPMRSS